MDYLIGEIGILVLVPGFIGLLIGLLMMYRFKTHAVARTRQQFTGQIRNREKEIDRLRSDLHHVKKIRSGNNQDRKSGRYSESVSVAREMSGQSASLTVKPQPASGKSSNQNKSSASDSRRGPAERPEKHKAGAAEATAKSRENPDHDKKSSADDEAFAKIQALASLGEKERQLQTLTGESGTQTARFNSAIQKYQKNLEQKNRQVEQLQLKLQELMSVKTQSQPSTAGPAASDQSRLLKLTAEDESYAKLQALASLGEAERKLSSLENVARPEDNELIALRRHSAQQEALIQNLQKRLNIQQNQAAISRQELERKASKASGVAANVDNAKHYEREKQLTAALDKEAFGKSQALAKLGEAERRIVELQQSEAQEIKHRIIPLERRAEQQESIIGDLKKRLEVERNQSDVMKQGYERKLRELHQNSANTASVAAGIAALPGGGLQKQIDDESFAKVKALATVGELQRKLAERETVKSTDHELTPLRRRAEQQESIIGDLRKRLDIQQKHSETLKQQYEQKLRNNPAGSSAEVDSYRRKLLEAERATQSRIKDFNATLEARNNEYDQLGLRLDESHQQIALKDSQLSQLTTELELRVKERSEGAAERNQMREKLGALDIQLHEKDASLKTMKARIAELERRTADVQETEKQLADFTVSTEKSAQKFEAVILEQRNRIEKYESDIARLRAERNDNKNQFEHQILSLKSIADEQTTANARQSQEISRFRSATTGKDTQISDLSRQLRAATQRSGQDQAEIRKLSLVAAENEKLQAALVKKEQQRSALQQKIDQAQALEKQALEQHQSMLKSKDADLDKLTAELASVRGKAENSQNALRKIQKDFDLQRTELQRVRERHATQNKQSISKIAEIEPLKLKLVEKEAEASRLRSEHDLIVKRSAEEVDGVRLQLNKIESISAEQLSARDKQINDLKKRAGEVPELRAEINKAETELRSLRDEMESQRLQKLDAENQIRDLQKVRDQQQLKLEQQQTAADGEQSQLNETLEKNKKQLEESKKRLETQQRELKELETVRATLLQREDELKKLRVKLTSLNEEADQHRQSIQSLKQEVESAKSAQVSTKQKFAEQAQKLGQLDSLIVSLRGNVTDRDKQVESAQNQIAEHQASLVKLKADSAAELEQKIAAFSREATQQTEKNSAALAEKQQQLTALKSQHQAAVEKHTAASTQHQAEIDRIQRELAERDRQARESLVTLDEVKTQFRTAQVELSRIKKELHANEEGLATAKAHATTLGLKIKEMEPLRAQITELESQRVSQLASLKSSDDKYKAKITGLEQQLAGVQTRLQSKETDYHKLQADLKVVSDKRAGDIARYEAERKTSITELESLRSKLAEMNKLSKQLASSEQQLKQLEQLRSHEKNRFDDETSSLRDKLKELDTLRSELSANDQAFKKLQSSNEEQARLRTAEITGLTAKVNELESFRERLSSSESEYRKLQQSHAAANDRHIKQLAELQTKVQEGDRVRQQLAQRETEHSKLAQQLQEVNKRVALDVAAQQAADKKLESLASELMAGKAEINRVNETRDTEAKASQEEIQSLKSQVQRLQPLEKSLSEKQAEFGSLQKQLQSSTDKHAHEVRTAQERITKLDASSRALEKQLSESRQQLQASQSSAQAKADELKVLQTKIQALEPLQEKLAISEGERDKLKAAVTTGSNELTQQQQQFEKRISELDGKLRQRESAYQDLEKRQQAEVSKATAELQSLQQKISALEPLKATLADKEASIRELESANKAIAAKLSAESATLRSELDTLKPLPSKLADAEARLKESEARQLAAKQQFESTQKEREQQLTRLTSEATAKTTAAEQQLQALRKESESTAATLRDQLDQSRRRVAEIEPLQRQLASRDAELKRIHDESSAQQVSLRNEVHSLQQQARRVESLQADLAARDEKLRNADKQLEGVRAAGKDYEAEMSRLKATIADKESRIANLAGKDKEVSELEDKLSEARQNHEQQQASMLAKLKAAQAESSEAETLRRRLRDHETAMEQSSDEIGEYKRRLSGFAEAERQLTELQKLLDNKSREHEELLRHRDREIAGLRKDLAETRADAAGSSPLGILSRATPAPQPTADSRPALTADGKKTRRKDGMDDLKLIFGIGPKIEQMLNEQGVRHFRDIAAWDDADVSRYSEMLEGFPDRIERDEWVLSAQQIQAGTYNWEERRKARETAAKTVKSSEMAKASNETRRVAVTADGRKTTRKDGMDDLKLIFGIGTKIEKMLNRKGVKRFEDIAAWGEADIKRFSDMLEGFPDRIERDEWVLSAKQIIAGTYNWIERKKARTGKS